MFRHLLKLIWKRKARNLMLSLEILLAFVIVFAIAAFATRNYQLYQLPTGLRYEDVWSVTVQTPDPHSKADAAVYDNFRRTLQAMPEIEQVAFASLSPYIWANRRTTFRRPDGGASVSSNMMDVSDDFFAVSGMTLVEGRWFSGADDGAADTPVVLNRRAAHALFPGESAVGKVFSAGGVNAKHAARLKVTGVVDDYRSRGEFMSPVNVTLTRFKPGSGLPEARGMKRILVKLKSGTPRLFEARLSQQLKLVRNDWSYVIAPLADLRSAMLRTELVPLVVVSVIAAFLLVMVGFGLFGVLWQNTTQRIPEIGLRRAVGASAGDIYRQIIAEQMLLSSAAMAVALLMLVQLPLTGVLGERLNWKVFLAAAALSMAVIYLISLLCSLYPGWRASRLSPTQALHYE
jgi:putative ABC transport system permease protein